MTLINKSTKVDHRDERVDTITNVHCPIIYFFSLFFVQRHDIVFTYKKFVKMNVMNVIYPGQYKCARSVLATLQTLLSRTAYIAFPV